MNQDQKIIKSISRLVEKGFHKHNLLDLIQKCEVGIRTSERGIIILFVLKALFNELLQYVDGGAVEVEQYNHLTNSIMKNISSILEQYENLSADQIVSNLEILILNYYSNRYKTN